MKVLLANSAFIIISILILGCSADGGIFSFGSFVALGVVSSSFFAGFNTIKCALDECCQSNSKWIQPNGTQLSIDLKNNLHGQHLVQDVVLKAIMSHYEDNAPKKALVLSLHGDTGTGKNFVSDIISNSLFKKGDKSNYITKFIASVDFPHENKVDLYKLELIDKIREQVSSCHRSLFIFDEVHKLPDGLIDAIKPFIDYHTDIKGVDYRKSVFIFLSNTGTKDILKFMLGWWGEGKTRADITLRDIEPLVVNGAFNEKGGLHMSELIQHSLVDYYIPFLPLERRHIEMCARDDLISRRKKPDPAIIRQIGDDMVYFPESNPLFASKGCKNVHQKVGYLLINMEYS